jgi:hypothetical protein
MIRSLRMLDAIFVALSSHMLERNYRKHGIAPIGTQFVAQSIIGIIGGIAGCYLVSRWSIPSAITGLILIAGAGHMIWLTSAAADVVRFWTQDMYVYTSEKAELYRRHRIIERLLSMFAFVICFTWTIIMLYGDRIEEAMTFLGLSTLGASQMAGGYFRCAPPPMPLSAADPATDRV